MFNEQNFRAIVLINAEPSREPHIERALRQLTQDQAKANGGYVVYAHSVYGIYDIVAKIVFPSKKAYSNVLHKNCRDRRRKIDSYSSNCLRKCLTKLFLL